MLLWFADLMNVTEEEREIYADLPKFSSGVSLLGGGGVVWYLDSK